MNNFLKPEDAFLFDVDCEDIDQELCHGTNIAFESAGMRIAEQLRFRQQIVVYVEFARDEFEEVNSEDLKLRAAYYPATGRTSGQPFRN